MYSEKFLAHYIRNRSLQLINSKWVASTRIKVFLSFGKSQGLAWHSARSSPQLLLSLLCRISIFRNVISRSNLVAAAPAIRPTFLTARNRTERKKKKTCSSPLTHTICSHHLIRTGYKTTLSQKRGQDSKLLFQAASWLHKELRVLLQGRKGQSFWCKRPNVCVFATHTHKQTVISLILLLRMRFKFF